MNVASYNISTLIIKFGAVSVRSLLLRCICINELLFFMRICTVNFDFCWFEH